MYVCMYVCMVDSACTWWWKRKVWPMSTMHGRHAHLQTRIFVETGNSFISKTGIFCACIHVHKSALKIFLIFPRTWKSDFRLFSFKIRKFSHIQGRIERDCGLTVYVTVSPHSRVDVGRNHFARLHHRHNTTEIDKWVIFKRKMPENAPSPTSREPSFRQEMSRKSSEIVWTYVDS